jgi:hypothetical protein
MGKMKGWLLQENEEPKRAPRLRQPEIVVYYWDGSAPEGRTFRDISQSGAYLCTPERWYIGTIIRLVLQGYATSELLKRRDSHVKSPSGRPHAYWLCL